jgi:hypothetical protein
MKAKLAALAALVIFLLAVTWLWSSAETVPERTPEHRAAVQTATPDLSPAATQDRLLLSQAQIQQAMIGGVVDRPIKSLLKVSGPLQFGDYRWDDTAIPPGPTWVRVDLGKQLLSVFRDGHEIGTSVIVYGGDNKQTPPGTLHVLAKARDHRSSLYDADMPYTLRLTDDGVSIHGSTVASGKATHGCVGIPLAFAERLFDTMKVGDEVVIIPPRKAASLANS